MLLEDTTSAILPCNIGSHIITHTHTKENHKRGGKCYPHDCLQHCKGQLGDSVGATAATYARHFQLTPNDLVHPSATGSVMLQQSTTLTWLYHGPLSKEVLPQDSEHTGLTLPAISRGSSLGGVALRQYFFPAHVQKSLPGIS